MCIPIDKINILNKRGMLSDDDRKERFEHGCSYVTFDTCLDLSKPIKVIPYGSGDITVENYSRDIASFIAFWNHFVMKDLNGFSGFGSVKFDTSLLNIIQP